MPTSMFKIYDGRTSFWQWDTKQKLIVLDNNVTEVHFANRDMNHSITRNVYEFEGKRVCNVPDIILQLPRNLVAYAYADGKTVKSVKFAVIKRPIPDGYVMDAEEDMDDITRRLEALENALKDISTGQLKKFTSIEDAKVWAQESKESGTVIIVRIDNKWTAHIIEDDYTVTPICDCNGNMVVVDIRDGGDADGYNESEQIEVQIWDGGNAAGI